MVASHGKFIDRQIGTYTFGGQSSDFRYAYINGIGYAGNRLHVSWVWRDRFARTSVTNQHDLCYAYSDDDGLTWNNSGGTNIGVTGSSFINLDSPGLVVSAINPWTNNLANQTTQYVYPDGGVHVMLRRYIDGTTTTRFHHHWRDPAGNWHFEVTPRTGNRPELIGDDQRNLFLIYKGAGELRVLKGVPNAGVTAWNWSSPALIYQQGSPEPGGDGQIELSRWHSERVLSIYHQDEPSTILDYGSGTPFDGLPTPLHVTDLQVSLRAAQPDPSHQALHVPTNTSLGWAAESHHDRTLITAHGPALVWKSVMKNRTTPRNGSKVEGLAQEQGPGDRRRWQDLGASAATCLRCPAGDQSRHAHAVCSETRDRLHGFMRARMLRKRAALFPGFCLLR